MSFQTKRSPVALQEVLYEFSLATDRPSAAQLEEFVRRYPEYATELTDFAIELVIDFDRKTDVTFDVERVSPVVSRALSKYQNALHARMSKSVVDQTADASSKAACENPFASLDRQSFRTLAHELNVSLAFLCKVRDCLIDPATMTEGFRRYLAEKMGLAMDQLTNFVLGRGPKLATQFYKADQKPEAQPQQSFEAAVRNSGLTQEQRDFLLRL